jgi:hypothetical protein
MAADIAISVARRRPESLVEDTLVKNAKPGERDTMPEFTEQWSQTLATLWEQQSQWSSAASIYKGSHRSWNGPLIIFGFIGVVFSTISPFVVAQTTAKPEDWTLVQFVLAVMGPAVVAVAAVLTREILGPKSEQKWIKAREVSEALKAEGYIFAVSAPPYFDPATAPTLLAAKIGELTTGIDGLGPLPPPKETPDRNLRPLSLQEYIDQRVKAQRAYHDGDARRYAGTLARWRAVAIVLMAVSATLGIIAGFGKQASINVWVAVVSTALATLTAYVTASRFEFLAATYAATSERLQSLVTTWEAQQNPTAAEKDRFVLDCEAVLAAQNRTWADELSKRVSDKLKATPPPPAS